MIARGAGLLARWPIWLPWSAALATLAVAPGVAILDAHAALLLAPIIGICAGAWTRRALRRPELPPSRVAGGLFALIVAPALQFALHGLWLPWCDPLGGALLWLGGPAFAALIGACMALLAAGSWPARPALAWSLIAFASALPPLTRFLFEPTVASWHELFGMIPGSLYEDALAADERLWLFRASTTPLWLALGAWGWSRRRGGAPSSQRLALAVAAAAWGVGWQFGATQGWRVDREAVLRELRVTRTVLVGAGEATPAAVIHLAATPGWQARAALLEEDVGVAWRTLRAFFGTAPREPVEIFVYADDRQKSRLMGADAVEMAKPWLHQAHLVQPGFGESILVHEMAHVFGAALSDHPLGVPMRAGLLPDAVRIEGLAVAAEWPSRGGLDPDAEAAAMRKLGLAPPIAALMSPTGFASESSARAYVLAGSLLRWVWRRCGRQALAAVYRGAELDAACRLEPGEVVRRWEAELDRPLTPALTATQLAYAEARFESPGILRRPCALAIGRCRRASRADFRAGRHAAARRRWHELHAALSPHLGAAQLPLWLDLVRAAAEVRADDHEAARRIIDARLAKEPAPRALDRAALLTARGDLALRRGDADAARTEWRAAAQLPRSEPGERTLLVKDLLSRFPTGAAATLDLLALGGEGDNVRARWHALALEHPEQVVTRYLDGRMQILGGGIAEADPDRDRARAALRSVAGDREAPRLLRREARRLLALDAARRGECAEIDVHAAAAGDDRVVQAWRERFKARCAEMRRSGEIGQAIQQ